MRGSPSGSSKRGARPPASARAVRARWQARARAWAAGARTPADQRRRSGGPVRSSDPAGHQEEEDEVRAGVGEQRRGGPVKGLADHSAPVHHRSSPEVAGVRRRRARARASRPRSRASGRARARSRPPACARATRCAGGRPAQRPRRSRTAAADRRLRRPGTGARPPRASPTAPPSPVQSRKPSSRPHATRPEPDRVDGGPVQLGQAHPRDVRARHALRARGAWHAGRGARRRRGPALGGGSSVAGGVRFSWPWLRGRAVRPAGHSVRRCAAAPLPRVAGLRTRLRADGHGCRHRRRARHRARDRAPAGRARATPCSSRT